MDKSRKQSDGKTNRPSAGRESTLNMSATKAAKREQNIRLADAETVIDWFRDANSERYRKYVPKAADVSPIVRLVNEYRLMNNRTPSKAEQNTVKQHLSLFRKLGGSLRAVMRVGLPLCEILSKAPEDKKALRLILHDIEVAPTYFRHPSGRRAPPWRIRAVYLVPHIRRAWIATGRRRPGFKFNGPLVKVLCQALEFIDGRHLNPETVQSALETLLEEGKFKEQLG
jgi:hypothetical protein